MTAAPGWYPDPTATANSTATLRYWNGEIWTKSVAPRDAQPKIITDRNRIEPWALVISLIPFVGIIGGAVSMIKGKTLTGGLMILIGFVSIIATSLR